MDENKKLYQSMLGGVFTMGYMIRKAEESFRKVPLSQNNTRIENDTELKDIINSTEIPHRKIVLIVELLDSRSEIIGIGNHVIMFSIVGLDNIKKLFDLILTSFFENRAGEITSIIPDTDVARELIWRNCALGYCFRIGEELIGNI